MFKGVSFEFYLKTFGKLCDELLELFKWMHFISLKKYIDHMKNSYRQRGRTKKF